MTANGLKHGWGVFYNNKALKEPEVVAPKEGGAVKNTYKKLKKRPSAATKA